MDFMKRLAEREVARSAIPNEADEYLYKAAKKKEIARELAEISVVGWLASHAAGTRCPTCQGHGSCMRCNAHGCGMCKTTGLCADCEGSGLVRTNLDTVA